MRLLVLALSCLQLLVAAYFTVTNQAFVLRGCRLEDYPEVAFALVVIPLSVTAVAFSLASVRADRGSRRSWVTTVIGVLLLTASAMLSIYILAEPGGGNCARSSAI